MTHKLELSFPFWKRKLFYIIFKTEDTLIIVSLYNYVAYRRYLEHKLLYYTLNLNASMEAQVLDS